MARVDALLAIGSRHRLTQVEAEGQYHRVIDAGLWVPRRSESAARIRLLYRKALEIAEKAAGSEHAGIARTQENYPTLARASFQHGSALGSE
jgi:hypothetical protein